jgi:hypothetical protein
MSFLGALAKLRKAIISFVMPVRPSVHMDESAHAGRFSMIFDIEYFSKICRENSSFIKIGQE